MLSMAIQYEYVVFGGFCIVEVGPPSRRTKVLGLNHHVFQTERDARAVAKEQGGTWVKRRKHKATKVELKRGRMVLAKHLMAAEKRSKS